MLLVYGRVRPVPTKWRAKGIRCWIAFVFRRTRVLFERQTRIASFRTSKDSVAKVSDNRVPACLLRCRELRGRQTENDVKLTDLSFQHAYRLIASERKIFIYYENFSSSELRQIYR